MRFHLRVDFDRDCGGYYQQLSNTGEVLEPAHRHLFNTTRGAYTYALAAKIFGPTDPELAQACVQGSRHGVQFLQRAHLLSDGSYAANLECKDGKIHVVDATKLCYGHAFVLLAMAGAHLVGAAERSDVEGVWDLLEARFYRPSDKLYVDEIAADGWDQVSPCARPVAHPLGA